MTHPPLGIETPVGHALGQRTVCGTALNSRTMQSRSYLQFATTSRQPNGAGGVERVNHNKLTGSAACVKWTRNVPKPVKLLGPDRSGLVTHCGRWKGKLEFLLAVPLRLPYTYVYAERGKGGVLPALDPTVVLVKPGDTSEGLMVEADETNGGPRVKTETFKCPDNATSLEVERGSGKRWAFKMARLSTATADGIFRLFLLKGGAEVALTRVAV